MPSAVPLPVKDFAEDKEGVDEREAFAGKSDSGRGSSKYN